MSNQKMHRNCKIHQQEFVAIDVDPSESIENRHLCLKCLDQENVKGKKIIFYDEVAGYVSDLKSTFKYRKLAQSKKNQEILKEFSSNVLSLKFFYNQLLDKINENIQNTLIMIEAELGKLDEKLEQLDINSNFQTQNEFAKCMNYEQVQMMFSHELIRIKENEHISKCINTISSLDQTMLLLAPDGQLFPSKFTEKESGDRILNYQLLTEKSIHHEKKCQAFAFNSKQNILFVGSGSEIIVFEFSQGQLKQKQVLNGHTNIILMLCFMKQSNKFISGGNDASIRIWGVDNSNQWYCSQFLSKAHESYVDQVIVNKNEDLMISCSHDKSIKFWKKKNNNNWECSQTLLGHTNCVLSICMNESENQIVSCEKSNAKILLSALNENNQQWEVKQHIQVYSYGARLNFIGNNIITFQPINEKMMEIFKLNEKGKFVKSTEVKIEQGRHCCDYWFPQQFNKEKSILLNKNGDRINLLKKKENDEFVVEQSILFENHYIWGAMTDDGEYLVTWDDGNKQFQVRKLQ